MIIDSNSNLYHHMCHDGLFENYWIFSDIPQFFGREEISIPKDVKKYDISYHGSKKGERKKFKMFLLFTQSQAKPKLHFRFFFNLKSIYVFNLF